MEDKTVDMIGKTAPLVAAIIVMGIIAVIEAEAGETNIVSAMVGLIGLLAGIKLPPSILGGN